MGRVSIFGPLFWPLFCEKGPLDLMIFGSQCCEACKESQNSLLLGPTLGPQTPCRMASPFWALYHFILLPTKIIILYLCTLSCFSTNYSLAALLRWWHTMLLLLEHCNQCGHLGNPSGILTVYVTAKRVRRTAELLSEEDGRVWEIEKITRTKVGILIKQNYAEV